MITIDREFCSHKKGVTRTKLMKAIDYGLKEVLKPGEEVTIPNEQYEKLIRILAYSDLYLMQTREDDE